MADRIPVEHRGRKYPGLYMREGKGGLSFMHRTWVSGKLVWVPLKARTVADAVGEWKLLQGEENPVLPSTTKVNELWAVLVAYRTGPLCRPSEQWSPGTLDLHTDRWTRNIAPRIGHLKVQDVTAHHINRIYEDMRTKPWEHQGKSGMYSEGSIIQAYSTLRALFHEAKQVRNGPLRNTSPLDGADNPEAEDVNPVTAEDILDWETECVPLFAELQRVSNRDFLIVRLAATTGMRVSEIVGLVWNDIDLDEGKILLSRQLNRDYRKSHGVGDEARSVLKWDKRTGKAKVRELVLSPEMTRLLREHRKEELARERVPFGEAFLFSTASYHAVNRHNIRRAIVRAGENVGITKPVGMHVLRHAYASWLFAGGASAEEVREELGHSSAAFTEKRYITVIPSAVLDERKRERKAAAGIN